MTLVVVVLVAAAAVDVTSFVTESEASKEAFKTATLLKTLNVNALIRGDEGVGKSSLAKYILPDAPIIDASMLEELLIALESTNELIIINLENSPNIQKVVQKIQESNVRIVATAKGYLNNDSIDELFSVKFDIPPLVNRVEDIAPLVHKFSQEASILFGCEYEISVHDFTPDVSQNAKSLRRQVMIYSLLHDINDNELIDIMESFLEDKIGSNSDYRKFLYLYEVPLIRTGLKKFKSQLQLADRLGLNRNTLRKKIADHKDYL